MFSGTDRNAAASATRCEGGVGKTSSRRGSLGGTWATTLYALGSGRLTTRLTPA